MTKCIGCGITLSEDINDIGYCKNIDNKLCERCFRVKHYNDYKVINKDTKDINNILELINKTKDLVILVVDLMNIDDLNKFNILKDNPILLVLTKRDLLPDVYEDKILHYITNSDLNIIDKLIVSSANNYNFDLLYQNIHRYKVSKDVYVVGLTNAGKSTLINKIIKNYSSNISDITTSLLPNTTLDLIKVDIDNTLTLIDTPGLIDDGNIINYIDTKDIKNIIPMTKIRPITYQVKAKQTFILGNIVRLDVEPYNDVIFYITNKIDIKRYYKDINSMLDLDKHVIKVNGYTDIVIKGLGFINIKKKGIITLYTLKGVGVTVRDELIGLS